MALLSELVDGVYRDLADEGKEIFTQKQVEDFVRAGIADLNRVAPVDTYEDVEFVADPDTGVITQWAYPLTIELPYRVTVRRVEDDYAVDLTTPVDGMVGTQPFEYRRTATGGTIEFPKWYLTNFNGLLYGIRVYGYALRPIPTSDEGTIDPAVSVSGEEEFSIRSFARAQGFDMLAHDRSLFAQWQGQTNNTDVSPTQMMQMEANAKQEWDRHRGLIRVVRRFG